MSNRKSSNSARRSKSRKSESARLEPATIERLPEKPRMPKKGNLTIEQYRQLQREYGAQRNKFLARANQLARLHLLAFEPQPVGKYDIGVNRFVKAEDVDAGRRAIAALREILETAIEEQPREQLTVLRDALLQRECERLAQADELERIAAAPGKLEKLREELDRSTLLGEWTKYRVVDAANVDDVGIYHPISEEEAKAAGIAHVQMQNDVPAVERDVLHALMGHALEVARVPEEHRAEFAFNAGDTAEVERFISELETRLRADFERLQASGVAPTREDVDRWTEWRATLDDITQRRLRYASGRGARKGLPIFGEDGIVRAPGAIPDISGATSNALTGKPLTGNGKKADPARFVALAEQQRLRARGYRMGADFLTKHLEQRAN